MQLPKTHAICGTRIADNWRNADPIMGVDIHWTQLAKLIYAESLFEFDAYRKKVFPSWGLDFETIPWRYTQKDAIAFSGQGLVPVMVDGERVVTDSWRIALYLDEKYRDRPLMDSDQARGAIWAFKLWSERIHPILSRIVLLDIHARIHPDDKRYNSRLLIDACKPWEWKDRFPKALGPDAKTKAAAASGKGSTMPKGSEQAETLPSKRSQTRKKK